MLDGPDDLRRRQLGTDQRAATHAMLDALPNDAGPKVTTFRRGAAHLVRPPGSQTFQASDHFFSILLAPSRGISAAFASDKLRTFDAPTGMIVVSPADVSSRAIFSSTRETATIAIEPAALAELGARELGMGHVDLRIPAFETVDPLALHVAQLLKAELVASHSPNELYIDSLVTLFSVHLLRNYTSGRKSPMKIKGGLSVKAARRIQEYMVENLTSKLSVGELAALCDLSLNHFIQAFTKTFGEQPYRYVIGLRLDYAEKLLLSSDLPYGMVAKMSGFSSHSHLTATMSRFKGTTPAKIRQSK